MPDSDIHQPCVGRIERSAGVNGATLACDIDIVVGVVAGLRLAIADAPRQIASRVGAIKNIDAAIGVGLHVTVTTLVGIAPILESTRDLQRQSEPIHIDRSVEIEIVGPAGVDQLANVEVRLAREAPGGIQVVMHVPADAVATVVLLRSQFHCSQWCP